MAPKHQHRNKETLIALSAAGCEISGFVQTSGDDVAWAVDIRQQVAGLGKGDGGGGNVGDWHWCSAGCHSRKDKKYHGNSGGI